MKLKNTHIEPWKGLILSLVEHQADFGHEGQVNQ
jgi:hypothetical protein